MTIPTVKTDTEVKEALDALFDIMESWCDTGLVETDGGVLHFDQLSPPTQILLAKMARESGLANCHCGKCPWDEVACELPLR